MIALLLHRMCYLFVCQCQMFMCHVMLCSCVMFMLMSPFFFICLFFVPDNIHAIRGSLEKLVELCSTDIRTLDDTTFYSKLEATQWLHYVRLLLSSAARIAVILAEEGASCVTHCSDGKRAWNAHDDTC